jgi:DNA-3-methyladenine glycosylase
MSKRKQVSSSSLTLSKKLKNLIDQQVVAETTLYFNKIDFIDFESRLGDKFYNVDCIELSKNLLNKYLVRKLIKNNKTEYLVGKIVEVEAYVGGQDKASHSFNNRRTERVKGMYMKAGTAYVNNIYGMYCCLNISSREPGAAVLIRAIEPVHGRELMSQNRNMTKLESFKEKDLTNGPSKICQAFCIKKEDYDQKDLSNCETLWLQNVSCAIEEKIEIVEAKRIGIDNSGVEAVNKLYRFYLKENKFVSVKSKTEATLE